MEINDLSNTAILSGSAPIKAERQNDQAETKNSNTVISSTDSVTISEQARRLSSSSDSQSTSDNDIVTQAQAQQTVNKIQQSATNNSSQLLQAQAQNASAELSKLIA